MLNTGGQLKLTIDDTKIFILRMIDGVRHKIGVDKDGKEYCVPFPETEEERKR